MWLQQIEAANRAFVTRIDPARLPTARSPGALVITCMDPRVNLAAIGVPPFTADGANDSPTRIVRTIGAMAEERSLVVGLYLANVREVVVLMHTDCGCCLAARSVDTMIERMQARLSEEALQRFRAEVGEPFRERLLDRIKAFDDPHDAVRREVAAIRSLAFVPSDLIVHGLVYTLATGRVEVVVDGSR